MLLTLLTVVALIAGIGADGWEVFDRVGSALGGGRTPTVTGLARTPPTTPTDFVAVASLNSTPETIAPTQMTADTLSESDTPKAKTPISTAAPTPFMPVAVLNATPEVIAATETTIGPTQAGATRTLPGTDFTMIHVPAGEFLMGSDAEEVQFAIDSCGEGGTLCHEDFIADETPQRTIYLDAFWIMQTEVTNAQYAEFVKSDGYADEQWWSADGWSWRDENEVVEPSYWDHSDFNAPDQPVVGVSWYEAEAFANWLSAQTGVDLRLPTEAQWEKAARGTEGYIFPWGNTWDSERLNSCGMKCVFPSQGTEGDGFAQTAPVGSYRTGASPYGALDMAGNVWEWVADWYDPEYYADTLHTIPAGPDSGAGRVVRGSSWLSNPRHVRAATRGGKYAYDRDYDVGFRLASPGF